MLTLTLLLGCATEGAETPAPPMDAASTLAAADHHDGQVDKVVHECAMCGLGMAGDPAHASTHEGYTLHFCSEQDKQAWDADVSGGMARLSRAVAKAP